MAAVTSGSMDPSVSQGDAVVIVSNEKYQPAPADDNGVVTWEAGKEADYRMFGDYGSVIVFVSSANDSQATVHRAMLYVEEGENWYDRANKSYLDGAESCDEIRNCPAPHAGYITKGDANPSYDQAVGMSPPIQDSWVVGRAKANIPGIGWVRIITGI
jgi:signal peptidase